MPIAFVHLAAAIWFVAVLTVIGWPISMLLRSRGVPFPAPLAGLCVIPIWAWYWVEITDRGLEAGIWVLLAVSAVLCAITIVRRRSQLSGLRAGALHGVWVLAASVVVCVVVFSDLFRSPYLTTFSTGNNDVSNWLSHSQYLLDQGVRAGSAFAGYDFPASFEREATFGAFSILATAASTTGLDTWQIGGFVMLAFVGLVMLSVSTFVQQVTDLSAPAAVATAAAAITPMLFLYSVANFFFGHVSVIAIMPIVALLAFEMTQRRSAKELLPWCVALALSLAMMLFSYAPSILTVPVLLAAAGGGILLTGTRRMMRLGSFAAASLASLVLALALAPQLSVWAVRRLLLVSDGLWGWPLSTFLPHEILGLGRNPLVQPSLVGWAATAAILVGVTYVAYRQRDRAKFAVPLWWLVVGILASYGLMTWYFGAGHYNAWKWIAYLQPLFCASVYSLAALGVSDWMSRRQLEFSWGRDRDRGVSRRASHQWVVFSAATALALVALSNTHRMFSEPMEGPATGFIHTDGSQGLRTAPRSIATIPAAAAKAGIGEVNIDLPPHWETAWAWYALRDVRTYPVNPFWVPSSEPRAPWTLERVDAGETSVGQRVVPIGATYRFVERSTAPPADSLDGLDAELVVKADRTEGPTRVLRVRATNTGERCWQPSTKAPLGYVALRGQLIAASGALIQQDFVAKPIPAGSCVAPGWSLDTDLEVPPLQGGRLRLQLVSEGVGWFGESVEVSHD